MTKTSKNGSKCFFLEKFCRIHYEEPVNRTDSNVIDNVKVGIEMNEENKKILIGNMTDNLAMLRVRLGLTQSELAGVLGVSRHTIMNIENKKREMTWNNFLALVLLFAKNEETDKLLNVLEIYTEEFNDFLKQCSGSQTDHQEQQNQ